MHNNFYYVLSYQQLQGNGEYLVLLEYGLYNQSRSLPDHPPPENLVRTHTRDGYQFDDWSVVETVAGDTTPAWLLAFALVREGSTAAESIPRSRASR